MIGSKPGTNESIRLGLAFVPYQNQPRDFPPLSLFLETKTDDTGHFTFERVPPLNVEVYHSPKIRDGSGGTIPMSQNMSFHLQPGEVKSITVGGQGRPVVGHMVVNGYDGKINWRSGVYNLELVLPPTDELPDMMAFSRTQSAKIQAASSDEEKKRLYDEMKATQAENTAKQRAFYATDKGRDYFFQNRRYPLNFAEDGSFRVEDIPGGKYKLRMDLREGGDGPMNFSAPRIASLEREFTIPKSPGGRTDEPFDLGKIEMQARKILASGKVAPDFEVKTVDDKTIKLADYRGKYVLLDFWAVWCGPCVAEMPNLKATYDAYKDDKRFQMISLSLDPIAKTPRDFAAKNELLWTMGFLGEWSKTQLPDQYGVEGIPSIFLIGPDGKIIAKDLRGENIKATVSRALSKDMAAKAQ
jgi:peroxiredoxin